MKIGFLIRYFKPGMGGAENNCYYLARELAKDKKNKVSIFCSGKEEGEETIDNIKIYRSRETLNLTYYLAFYPSIVEKLIAADLDILHIHGFGFIQNDIAVKKLKAVKPGLKIVCTPHGPFMALRSYNIILRILKAMYMPFLRKNLRTYDKIIQVNPYQKEWLSRDYGIPSKKIVFLPNGITEEALKPSNKATNERLTKKYGLAGKFVVSYLGRVQRYKGIDQMIKIMPELLRTRPNLVFLVIGKDAGDAHRLKELAKDLEVEKSLVVAGEVSEEDKFALLDLSDVFIFPSDWEAFGIVVLEAMARGNAIVSTRTEGGLYLVEEGKNGYLFDYQDSKELSKKMRLVMKDGSMRKMQTNNVNKSKGFLWSNIAIKLKKIYLSLL